MISQLLQRVQGGKLAKETMWSFAAKGMTLVLYFGIDVILVRSLGAEYGRWSYFFATLTIFFVITRFGLDSSLKTFAAQYNNTPSLREVVGSAMGLRLILSTVAMIAIVLAREPLAALLDRPDYAQLFLYAIPLLFFTNLVNFYTQLFSGIHRVKFSFVNAAVEYGFKFLGVLSLAVLPFFSPSTEGTIIAFAVGAFLAAACSSVLTALYLRKMRATYSVETAATNDNQEALWKQILRYSMPLFFISIGFVIATEVDTVLLGRLQGDEAAGIYSVSKKMIVKLPQISLAIAIGTMPVFAKMTTDSAESLKRLFNKLLRTNTFIFLPIAAGILATSWFVVPWIYGAEYKASVLPMNILVVYLLTYSYSIYLSTFLDFRKKASKRAMNLTIAIVLNIILDIILIPKYGPAGAAAATSISYLPYIFLNWLEVRSEFKRVATQ